MSIKLRVDCPFNQFECVLSYNMFINYYKMHTCPYNFVHVNNYTVRLMPFNIMSMPMDYGVDKHS